MKVDKYRELISGIDTDRSTDEMIKNKLLYYQSNRENRENENDIKNKKLNQSYARSSIYYLFARISVLKQALPSLAFLMLLVIVVLGVRFQYFNETVTPSSGFDTTTETTVSGEIEITESEAIDTTESEDIDTAGTTEYSQETADTSTTDTNEDTTGYIDGIADNVEDTDNLEITDNLEMADNKEEDGTLYYVRFDIVADNKMKKSFSNLIVRFHGTVDSIDPGDFTDIVLLKDGNAVENNLTLTDEVVQAKWRYENITDFYFQFEYENNEPGVYELTGSFKGVPFTAIEVILEESVSDEPADSEDILSVSYSGFTDRRNNFTQITDLVFAFKGLQNSFYLTDLTELKITLNNEEIPFLLNGTIFRYYEVLGNDSRETWYRLELTEAFSEPGTYIITGKYQGKPFTFWEEITP